MALYVCVNLLDGTVDHKSIRDIPPSKMEVKHFRWIEVDKPVLNAWERLSDLPHTISVDAKSVTFDKTGFSLGEWKSRRVNEIRSEQWSRIAAVYHIGQIINYYAIAIRLINKKASGGTLTAPETGLLNQIGAGVANNIEPISAAADATISAINNATTYAAVEAAYNAIVWP